MAPINSSTPQTPTPAPVPIPGTENVPQSACLSLYGYTPPQRLLDGFFGRIPQQGNDAIFTTDRR